LTASPARKAYPGIVRRIGDADEMDVGSAQELRQKVDAKVSAVEVPASTVSPTRESYEEILPLARLL